MLSFVPPLAEKKKKKDETEDDEEVRLEGRKPNMVQIILTFMHELIASSTGQVSPVNVTICMPTQ